MVLRLGHTEIGPIQSHIHATRREAAAVVASRLGERDWQALRFSLPWNPHIRRCFAGAPWTIFAYMVEGGGSKTFSLARRKLYQDPEFSMRLLDMITESTINYLKAQVEAGADLIQVFDS